MVRGYTHMRDYVGLFEPNFASNSRKDASLQANGLSHQSLIILLFFTPSA